MARWVGAQGQVTSAKKTQKYAPLWRNPQKSQKQINKFKKNLN